MNLILKPMFIILEHDSDGKAGESILNNLKVNFYAGIIMAMGKLLQLYKIFLISLVCIICSTAFYHIVDLNIH